MLRSQLGYRRRGAHRPLLAKRLIVERLLLIRPPDNVDRPDLHYGYTPLPFSKAQFAVGLHVQSAAQKSYLDSHCVNPQYIVQRSTALYLLNCQATLLHLRPPLGGTPII